MKKKLFVILLVSLFVMPVLAFAEENNDFYLVSEETKYYKTVTPLFSSSSSHSTTYEISKEEYDAVDLESIRSNPTIYETTYKSMTSSILQNGSYYRYKNILSWKKMPSTRSYDIIAIGFLPTVKIHNNTTYFNQYYCYSDGSGCYTTYTNYPQIFSAGAGTSYALPTGGLSTLRETFYFDVEKNTTNTINTQVSYADYAHATSTVSLNDSKKYTVAGSGAIYLNTSISGNYDTMSTAIATWNGTW